MTTLAIDIGGTKFSIAAFRDGRLIRRESRSTDKQGGRDWMLAQLAAMTRAWRAGLTWAAGAISRSRRIWKTSLAFR
jgi:predicted NBD/HSP70 family sugar kinase